MKINNVYIGSSSGQTFYPYTSSSWQRYTVYIGNYYDYGTSLTIVVGFWADSSSPLNKANTYITCTITVGNLPGPLPED